MPTLPPTSMPRKDTALIGLEQGRVEARVFKNWLNEPKHFIESAYDLQADMRLQPTIRAARLFVYRNQ